MTEARSRLAVRAHYLRTRGVKAALEVGANFVLPYLIYTVLAGRFGAVPALMAAGASPILWSIGVFIRERKVDAISVLVLAGLALSLIAFVGGGGVRMLQLRETLVTGLVGLVFLGSAAVGRPLMLQLARAGARRRGAESGAAMDAVRTDPRFRRAMTGATLAWGAGLLSVCTVNVCLVFLLPIGTYLLMSGPMSYAAIGALTAWTFWFTPRALRAALARRQAASA